MKLPIINGREAVPVRLIPFLVNWNPLPPDALAHLFAGTNPIHQGWCLVAYRVDARGDEFPIHPEAWWNTADSLDALSIILQREGSRDAEWERESVGILPAGAFVWRDEFEAEYRRKFGGHKAFSIPAAARLRASDEGGVPSFDELVADLSSAEDEDDFFSGENEHVEVPRDQMDNLFSYAPTGRDGEVFEGLEKFMSSASQSGQPAKPVQRPVHQEAVILEEIRRLGFDPLALPTVPNGRASPEKAAVRAALRSWSDAVFTKAWKRLTAAGGIGYR